VSRAIDELQLIVAIALTILCAERSEEADLASGSLDAGEFMGLLYSMQSGPSADTLCRGYSFFLSFRFLGRPWSTLTPSL